MIPRTIHQIWIGTAKKPDRYMKTWYEDYVNQYPHYTYQFWDDNSIDNLLNYNSNIKRIYDLETTMFGKADIARYLILYYFGGIYIDADSVWVNNKNLDEFINEQDFFIGREPISQSRDLFANGVMGCTQFNNKIQIILDKLESIVSIYSTLRQTKQPWQLTGPYMTNMFNKTNPTHKYVIVYHKRTKICTMFYDTLNDAQIYFKQLIENQLASILVDIVTFTIIDKYGDHYADLCKNFIDDAYDNIYIAPSHFFYPISWIGIADPDLHTKININPESFMFQYGISTNNLNY